MALLGFLRAIVGVAVLLAPGVALVWALLPELDRAKQAAVAVVLAFTVVPALALFLNVGVRLPITGATFVVLSLLVTAAAVAWRVLLPRWRARAA